MWQGSSAEIAGFIPDRVVTITEGGEESDMEEAVALKRNCYQTTRREVEQNNPGAETRLMTFIISILG
eukprot:129739-Rhodomonas_salina.1